MKKLLILSVFLSGILQTRALVISEVMSNPVGTDDGREWVEVYNDTSSSIDVSGITVSIKNGNAVSATLVQGGTLLEPHSYAVIGSTVSSQTKFLQDYPTYAGILLKSPISLVNTGITSIDIKVGGSSVDTLASYTAAKEGVTLSLVGGAFVASDPTPGTENQQISQQENGSSGSILTTATTTENQTTVAQMSPPSADIVFYMPFEKTVVAGADTDFSTHGMTRGGKVIEGLSYTWAFGDGGRSQGATTTYTYAYPGRYIAQVEGISNYIAGIGRMVVRVVPPDVTVTKISTGKYGAYIDIYNPNEYSLDLSQWRLTIDGASFPFPKNTLIAGNGTTHFSGVAMGFASTTVASSTVVKILFPNLEEVTKYLISNESIMNSNTISIAASSKVVSTLSKSILSVPHNTSTVLSVSTSSRLTYQVKPQGKDTRIVSFFKSIFWKGGAQ